MTMMELSLLVLIFLALVQVTMLRGSGGAKWGSIFALALVTSQLGQIYVFGFRGAFPAYEQIPNIAPHIGFVGGDRKLQGAHALYFRNNTKVSLMSNVDLEGLSYLGPDIIVVASDILGKGVGPVDGLHRALAKGKSIVYCIDRRRDGFAQDQFLAKYGVEINAGALVQSPGSKGIVLKRVDTRFEYNGQAFELSLRDVCAFKVAEGVEASVIARTGEEAWFDVDENDEIDESDMPAVERLVAASIKLQNGGELVVIGSPYPFFSVEGAFDHRNELLAFLRSIAPHYKPVSVGVRGEVISNGNKDNDYPVYKGDRKQFWFEIARDDTNAVCRGVVVARLPREFQYVSGPVSAVIPYGGDIYVCQEFYANKDISLPSIEIQRKCDWRYTRIFDFLGKYSSEGSAHVLATRASYGRVSRYRVECVPRLTLRKL